MKVRPPREGARMFDQDWNPLQSQADAEKRTYLDQLEVLREEKARLEQALATEQSRFTARVAAEKQALETEANAKVRLAQQELEKRFQDRLWKATDTEVTLSQLQDVHKALKLEHEAAQAEAAAAKKRAEAAEAELARLREAAAQPRPASGIVTSLKKPRMLAGIAGAAIVIAAAAFFLLPKKEGEGASGLSRIDAAARDCALRQRAIGRADPNSTEPLRIAQPTNSSAAFTERPFYLLDFGPDDTRFSQGLSFSDLSLYRTDERYQTREVALLGEMTSRSTGGRIGLALETYIVRVNDQTGACTPVFHGYAYGTVNSITGGTTRFRVPIRLPDQVSYRNSDHVFVELRRVG